MAFSDARNERDRAETGRNSSNHGGRDARAAADRNLNAMGLGVGHQFDTRARNTRYSQNQIATRPATLNNIGRAVINGLPGVGMIGKVASMVGGQITGNYDPYSGPRGNTTGFSYDGPNRFATLGSGINPAMPQGVSPMQAIRPAGAAQPITPPMPQSMVNPAMLSVGGGKPYGVNLPAFGYFGQPGQQRPQPAMFGMPRP